MFISKLIALISILVGLFFTATAGLIYPLWGDINAFLNSNFPVMPAAMLAGSGYIYFGWRWFKLQPSAGKVSRWGLWLMGLVDTALLAALGILFYALGSEWLMITRSAAAYLPVGVWFSALAALIWFGPRWKTLQSRIGRAVTFALLAGSAVLYASLPWQFKLEAQPVILMAQNGLTAAWGTNMPAVSWINYGGSPAMGQRATRQASGLLALGERVQNIFLEGFPTAGQDLNFQVNAEGVRRLARTTVVRAGEAQSAVAKVSFPGEGEEITLAAFSDLHERGDLYRRLSDQILWDQMDLAVYLGDLLNYTASPQQAAESLLNLPTGSGGVPRVLVRGNHESRGEGARSLDAWLLPPGGKWYFTFSLGNVFFTVLDSGEDKASTNPDYDNLVDFATYHRQQGAWLAEVFASSAYRKAAYRVVLLHIPPFIENQPERFGFMSTDFNPLANMLRKQSDIDLVMSGHIHEGGIWLPAETGFPYPFTTCGGSREGDMAAVSAHFTKTGIDLKVIQLDGTILDQEFIPKK